MGINGLKGYFRTNVGKGKTGMLKNIIQSRNETPSKHPSGFCQLTLKSLRQNFKEDMLLFIIAPEKEKAKAEALPSKMIFSKFKKYINSHHSTLTSAPLGW